MYKNLGCFNAPLPPQASPPYHLQALRIPLVARLASPRGAAGRSRPPLTATLSPHGRAVARLRGLRGRRRVGGHRARRRRGVAAAARGELAAHKLQRLLAILDAVLLVQVGVVAGAAVRVGAVAVVLDLGGRVGAADVAARAGGELFRVRGPSGGCGGKEDLHPEQCRYRHCTTDQRRNGDCP